MLLAESGAAMNPRAMLDAIVGRGIWSSPNGKTPDATLNGDIVTEIRDKGADSRFMKVAPGRFQATPLFAETHSKSGLTLADYEPKPEAGDRPAEDAGSPAANEAGGEDAEA